MSNSNANLDFSNFVKDILSERNEQYAKPTERAAEFDYRK